MKKIYLLFICIGLVCFSFTSGIQAQISTSLEQEKIVQHKIDGLRVFQNPAVRNVLYITSTKELTKTVTIYTVLGKRVMFEVLFGTELNISNLNAGVYVAKIKEGDKVATVKFIKS